MASELIQRVQFCKTALARAAAGELANCGEWIPLVYRRIVVCYT